MVLVKHRYVAKLKSAAPLLASVASRGYAVASSRRNRAIARGAETKSASTLRLWSVLKQTDVTMSEAPALIELGDVLIARDLLGELELRKDFSRLLKKAYGVSIHEVGGLHDHASSEQILASTEQLGRDAELLRLECTILRSLFATEPTLYAELMPNLRPHVPYMTVKETEQEIESSIGRGKMNAHGPHKDSWRFHPRNTINIWVALSDVTPLNGMFILPESAAYYPKFSENEIEFGCETYPGRQYLTDLKSGDAVLFKAELLHGSVINQTDRTRFAFSMRCSLTEPAFHRDFMYNYVQLLPSFSNLVWTKVSSRSDFVPPSTDEFSPDFGSDRHLLDIVEKTDQALTVETSDGQATFPRYCPHRGADLAFGTVEDGCLVCPQHQLRVRPTAN